MKLVGNRDKRQYRKHKKKKISHNYQDTINTSAAQGLFTIWEENKILNVYAKTQPMFRLKGLKKIRL